MNYVMIAGIALIMTLSIALKSQLSLTGQLREMVKTQALQTVECTDANAVNLETITTLKRSLDRITEARRKDAEAREKVLVERSKELAELKVKADQLERERRDEILINPDCKDLTQLRVGQFCSVTAGQLRLRSGGPGSN